MGNVQRHLTNRRLDRKLRRDGYVVVQALSPERVAAALEVFNRNNSGIDAGYYASIHSTDTEYKQTVDAQLREVIWSATRGLLTGHRCLIAAMMIKPPTGATVVPLHQDWNVIDESRCAGLTCWFPLTPVTELEGKMRVLPGSHRYMGRLRGSPGFPAPFETIAEQISDELLIDVDVEVGEVMIMDGRLLHMSGHNHSERTRVAAYLNVVPDDAPAVHYFRDPDGRVEGYEVEPDFFTTFNIGERPKGRLFTTIDDLEVEQMTMDDLLRRRRAARWRTGVGRGRQ